MPRTLALAMLALVAGCGESPTETASVPIPVVWTASLEMAVQSLGDPLVVESLDGLPDSPEAHDLRALVAEAEQLATARRVRDAAVRITTALDRLEGYPYSEGLVEADVLQLVLADVDDRFLSAIAPPPVSP